MEKSTSLSTESEMESILEIKTSEEDNMSKLKNIVTEIVYLYDEVGVPVAQIAKRLEVSESTVRDIVKDCANTWIDVQDVEW
jgi:DNA-directed RNA polymerase specialized sigma24 family protein